jgi:hypothetical protein
MGRANEALVFTDDFLRERPHFVELQSTRMKLAVFADRYEIALKAAALLPDPADRPVHEVIIRYEMGDYRGAVSVVDRLMQVPFKDDGLVAEALLVAAHCAHKSFNKSVSDRCLARLQESPDKDALNAVYRFVIAANGGKESYEKGLADLRKAYERSPESGQIQDHLVTSLRPTRAEDAALVVQIADQIRRRRSLFKREVMHVAQSLVTLDRTGEAIVELESARARIPGDIDLAALQALVHERVGDASRAMALLNTVLASDLTIPEFARSTYINLAARSGHAELAIGQFESLLSREANDAAKRDILRGIYSLELYRGAHSERLTWLAFSYGALADRNDEFSESLFLQMVLMAGLNSKTPLSDVEKSEFDTRARVFLEKYPDSKYFSTVELPEGMSAGALSEILRKKRGYTHEQVAELERLRILMERGEVVFPYAWRPRNVLSNVANVPHLWEFTKRTTFVAKSYTLYMNKEIRAGVDLRSGSRIPLIDIPTLLLLTELDLWDLTLKLFGTIAISKMTLLTIQTDASPLGFSTDTLLRLREAIANDIEKIVQPGKVDEDWNRLRDSGAADFLDILKEGKYVFYSDDYFLRVIVLGEAAAVNAVTVPDLIESLERGGDLSKLDAARRYARLVAWNVGNAPIYYKHLWAAVPPAVDDAADVDGVIFRRNGATGFSAYRSQAVFGIKEPVPG